MSYQVFYNAPLYTLAFRRTKNGLAAGTVANPDSVSTAAGPVVSAALRTQAFISFTPPSAERMIHSEFAGQRPAGNADLGPGAIATAPVAFSREISDLNALADGSRINTSDIAGVQQGGMNFVPDKLNNIGLFPVVGTSVFDEDLNENVRFAGLMMPNVQIGRTGAELTQIQSSTTNQNPINYTAAYKRVNRLPTGRLLSELNVGYQDTFMHPYQDMADQWWMIATVWWDGTATGAVLPWLPVYDEVAVGGRNQHVLYTPATGAYTPTALTTLNTSTGAFTLAAAPAAGAISVFMYPDQNQLA